MLFPRTAHFKNAQLRSVVLAHSTFWWFPKNAGRAQAVYKKKSASTSSPDGVNPSPPTLKQPLRAVEITLFDGQVQVWNHRLDIVGKVIGRNKTGQKRCDQF
ncbi:hypothetical protein N9381_07095 [Paracoccaceae bacterium]|nr:hypothetical protein [Paracoccaceae bacterium]